MNESVIDKEKGLEIRQILLRPGELAKWEKYTTDKDFKEYIANNSYLRPRIQAVDILEMELTANDSEKLPGKMLVVLARGHRDLGAFVKRHGACGIESAQDPETGLIIVRCPAANHNDSIELVPDSLEGNPSWRQEPFL